MRFAIICVTALILGACGDEKSGSKKTESPASAGTKTPSGPEIHTAKASKPTLTKTPISFADATGETSVMMEVGPCPFLSDKTIKASVRSTFDLTRQDVSNTECRWAYNAGFAITVTIEDLLAARPVSERQYNIGVDTILEPQDGPGDNALILNDTAWDKPIPFAYSFEKDGKLVFMSYTGFKIDVENMRVAANEIAARMGTAPTIERQRRQATEPFKACDSWTEQDLKTVFDAGETATIGPGSLGKNSCSWKIYEDGISGQRTVALNIYKPKTGAKAPYEYDGHEAYSENGETHYLRKSNSDFGLYIHVITPRPEGLIYVTVSDPEKDSTSVAKRLQNNILSRMVP